TGGAGAARGARLATYEDTGNRFGPESAQFCQFGDRDRRRGCGTVPPVFAPPWRVFGIAAAGAAAIVLPVSVGAAPGPSASSLRAHAQSIEQQKRSAVLSLYSLDSRLAAADARLAQLEQQAAALRAQRAALATELRLARVDARISQQRL